MNPELCGKLTVQKYAVVNRATGSRLDILSSHVGSSWGALPDFVICDELCHWRDPALWYSLFSSAAKRADCVLVVLTNAGVGRGWQWKVRETARTSPRWYFSSLAGPQAPWITDDWLDDQRINLPPQDYERLWCNIWQDATGEFITLAEAEACRDLALGYQHRGVPGREYVAAVDYAEKRDYTVGVVVHREGRRIVVDRMDVVVPQPNAPVRVAWVEEWMREVARNFHRVTFVLDEYQLVGTIQRLQPFYEIHRFQFSAGHGNHRLAFHLRSLILNQQVAWYAGCGQLETTTRRDNLETELASLLYHQKPNGQMRIDHHRDGTHHDDRAFALGAACLFLAEQPVFDARMEMNAPTAAGGINWAAVG
jgi:hypothetical protein